MNKCVLYHNYISTFQVFNILLYLAKGLACISTHIQYGYFIIAFNIVRAQKRNASNTAATGPFALDTVSKIKTQTILRVVCIHRSQEAVLVRNGICQLQIFRSPVIKMI